MMDPDKDLPFGDLDRISLDDDSKARAQKAAEAKPAQARPATAQRQPRPPQRQAATKASAGKLLPALVMLLLLLLLGLGGWSYTQISELQVRLNQQQNQSSNQLDDLKSQISAAGDNANATSDKLGDSLKSHGKELTRLAANDLATRKRVHKLEDVTDKLEAGIKKLNALNEELAALQQQMKLAAIASGQLQMQQDLNVSAVKELKATAAARTKQMQALADTPKDVAAINKQLNEVQASIRAFDKWRQQVGAKLNAAP